MTEKLNTEGLRLTHDHLGSPWPMHRMGKEIDSPDKHSEQWVCPFDGCGWKVWVTVPVEDD